MKKQFSFRQATTQQLVQSLEYLSAAARFSHLLALLHNVDLRIAVAVGREHYFRSVGRPLRKHIISVGPSLLSQTS